MIRIKISFGIIKIDGNICCRKVASLSTYERARAEAHVTLNLVTHYGWPFVAKFNNVYLYATLVTALFNNMRTLKLKAQPTNAFFATVNQMFGGSSQLPTMLSELYSTI